MWLVLTSELLAAFPFYTHNNLHELPTDKKKKKKIYIIEKFGAIRTSISHSKNFPSRQQ